jgi:hypothetical protein
MGKLYYYRVQPSPGRYLWRVNVPQGPDGYKPVYFKSKAKAVSFYSACRKELARTRRIDFLCSPRLLFDAIEALRVLQSGADKGHQQNRLRRAAALLALCNESQQKRGEFVEPTDRLIDLPPALFKGLVNMGRERGADIRDLVVAVLWNFVQEESEKRVKMYKNEDKVGLKSLL